MATTSSVSSLSSQLLRVNGMSSGLDTDSIVKSLLKIDQAKVDRQFQVKTKLEWKKDAYNAVGDLLKDFRAKNMSVLQADTNMMSSSAYNTYNVTMLDTTTAVSVSAGASAMAGNVTINDISQLAKAATLKSSNISAAALTSSTKLKDLALNTPLQFESGAISFSINGKTFSFTQDQTLGDVLTTVNADKDAGVTMSYSSLTKGFTIASRSTGASSAVNIDNLTGNAFAAGSSAFGISEQTVNGQNAKLDIEGVAVEKETNAFSIDGISYTLKNTSTSAISFNVERDVDATVTKIKNFINNYNSLIGTLQAKLDEDTHSDYPPLTDTQRAALSATDATKWDTMSKSGLLKNDSTVTSLLTTMRNAFYTPVSSVGMTLSDIGLNTGSYKDKGKITIDETKLRTALENNPDQVAGLFTSLSTSTDPTTKFNQSGLINRMSDAMNTFTKNNTQITLDNLNDSITSAGKKLTDLTDEMSQNEDRYYAKFTAMETALSKLNSQSSWLSTQFGSSSK